MDQSSVYQHLQGRNVVLDLASPYVYIGTLVRWDEHYLHLEDADVHDLRDTKTTREIYLVETKRLGINSNRKLVMIC
jgi:small nuclear ribonucleoprotein (snRNP)-like protein